MLETLWALEPTVFQKMLRHAATNAGAPAQAAPGADDSALLDAGGQMPGGMTVSKGVATIPVVGVLTKAPSFFAMFFGGGNTTYAGIVAAVQAAEGDPDVERVVFNIDSPGGAVMGLFDAADAIASMTKPTEARVQDLAASAAYALAVQADRVTVNNDSALVGSVGIMAEVFIEDNVKVITSTAAPRKAPDASTPEGEQVIRDRLDSLHAEFAKAIGAGRGTSPENVNSSFGRGDVVIAKDALAAGMIDAVERTGAPGTGTDGPFGATVTPLVDGIGFIESAWDAAGADKRVREHTDSNDDPNNSGSEMRQYRTFFAWYDGEKTKDFSSYKLPVADVENKQMVVNIKAVRKALSQVSKADIPDDDKERVESNLQTYLDRFNEQKEAQGMDLQKLKAEHPALFAEVIAMGKGEERDRVSAHVKMGTQTGAVDFAMKCIDDGASLTSEKVMAEYMSAGITKGQVDARTGDEPEADTGSPDAGDVDPDGEKAAATLLDGIRAHSKSDMKGEE